MSAEEIKKKKLNYLTCNQGDLHEGEQLNYVWLDSKSAHSVLLCPVCKTTMNDKKQKVIPLKIFLAETSAHIQSKQSSFTQETLLTQVENAHQKMLSSLRETVQKMAVQIKEVEDQINQSFKYIKQKLVEQIQVSQNFPSLFEQILNNNYENVNNLKQDVFKIAENIQYINNKITIDFKPQKVVDQYTKTQSEFTNSINTLNQQFKQQMAKVQKTLEKVAIPLQQSLSTNSSEFQFSQTLKSPTISLEGKIANQTTNQNYDKRFALIEPGLDLNSKTRFAFKITQLSNWVGLGICFVKVLQAKSFTFDYNNLGHGSYLISSNAYSWSHSKKEDNIAYKSFNFTTGDIIICEFDPEKKIVQFKKKGDNTKKFSLQIEIPDNDEVYACVNLCNLNDKVELVMNEVDEEEF